jgi:hypothetical protein
MNQGNINFRMAVEEMKSAYVSTPSRKAKKRIVRKTVKAIKAKNGRFLSKLRKSEIKMLGLPHKVVFEVVADNVAIEKTKQAIRYIHYKKDAGQDGKSQDLKAKKVGQSADKSVKKSGTSALSSSDDSDQSTASGRHQSNRNRRLPEVKAAWAPAPVDPSAKNLFSTQQFTSRHGTANLNPLAYSLASPFLNSHSPTLRGIQMPSPTLRGTPMGNPGLQDLPSLAIPGILPSLQPGGPSFLPARDFNALRAGAQASHLPESASMLPNTAPSAGRPISQSQSMLLPPPSQQEVTDFLRRHMTAGGPPQGGLTSEQMTADGTIRASLQLGQQLQAAAFQDDRLRAALLADEQRRFLNSYLSFPPR